MGRNTGKIIRPGDSVESRNGADTKGINLTLDQNLAHRLDGLLKSGGAATAQNLSQNIGLELPLVFAWENLSHMAQGVDQCQNGADCFGDNGGNGAAQDAEAQNAQENQIQNRVQNRGKGQKFQGRIRVAHTF